MNDKPFKTTEELIIQLVNRGMDITTSKQKSTAKKHLQRIGYYNLINGYNDLFLTGKDTYKTGTTIEEIVSLYNFDRKLREIFLKNILPLETNIKSLVAYYFPKAHPETNYLTYTNFDTTKAQASKHITQLLADIQRQISSRASDPSISHYLKNYGYIPLWVLNNILTLGTISKFYSLMQQTERQNVAKTFHMTDNALESALFYLSSIRNFCAHGNRLYCYRSKRPLSDFPLHKEMGIPQNANGEYIYGKRNLFAAMILFNLLLSKQDFKKLLNNIKQAINSLNKHLQVLTKDEILDSMGFPSDWEALLTSSNIK